MAYGFNGDKSKCELLKNVIRSDEWSGYPVYNSNIKAVQRYKVFSDNTFVAYVTYYHPADSFWVNKLDATHAYANYTLPLFHYPKERRKSVINETVLISGRYLESNMANSVFEIMPRYFSIYDSNIGAMFQCQIVVEGTQPETSMTYAFDIRVAGILVDK